VPRAGCIETEKGKTRSRQVEKPDRDLTPGATNSKKSKRKNELGLRLVTAWKAETFLKSEKKRTAGKHVKVKPDKAKIGKIGKSK